MIDQYLSSVVTRYCRWIEAREIQIFLAGNWLIKAWDSNFDLISTSGAAEIYAEQQYQERPRSTDAEQQDQERPRSTYRRGTTVSGESEVYRCGTTVSGESEVYRCGTTGLGEAEVYRCGIFRCSGIFIQDVPEGSIPPRGLWWILGL